MLPLLRHHAAAVSLISKTLRAPFFQRWDWKRTHIGGTGPYHSFLVCLTCACGQTCKKCFQRWEARLVWNNCSSEFVLESSRSSCCLNLPSVTPWNANSANPPLSLREGNCLTLSQPPPLSLCSHTLVWSDWTSHFAKSELEHCNMLEI